MVKKGADVNVKDIYGLRPLHFAAMRGNDIAASELLDCQNVVVDVSCFFFSEPYPTLVTGPKITVVCIFKPNSLQISPK